MLGRSQTFVIERANRLKLRPPEMLCKHWNLTLDDIKKIQDLSPKIKKSNIRLAAKHTGLTHPVVRRLAHLLKLRFRTDYEKILKACELYKTKEYTIKGIKARI